MILEIVTIQIKAGQEAAFEAAFKDASHHIASSDGYISHELRRCLETKGKFTGTTELKTNQVTGFIPRAANIRALYNYKKWGASASLNFTGEHIITRSTVTRAADVYRRKLTTVTLGLTYKLRPNATVYVDANNIFEEGPERYRYIASRTQIQTWGPMTINFGLSGQF